MQVYIKVLLLLSQPTIFRLLKLNNSIKSKQETEIAYLHSYYARSHAVDLLLYLPTHHISLALNIIMTHKLRRDREINIIKYSQGLSPGKIK